MRLRGRASKSHRAWTEAKGADDVSLFLPMLSEVVNLARQKAEVLADENTPLYDALLQDYEPDGSSAEITEIFDNLRPHLVDLRAEALERNRCVPVWPFPDGTATRTNGSCGPCIWL